MEWIQTFDHQILQWITQHFRNDWLNTGMIWTTALGNAGAIWILFSLIFLLRPTTRRCGIAMLTALVLGVLFGNVILKHLVARARPFVTYTDIIPLVSPGDQYSFPSGHTLASFGAATACICYFQKTGIAFYILAFLIGFSRLYVGVHYPTDVLAGAFLGIVLGFLAVFIVNQTSDRMRFRKIRN